MYSVNTHFFRKIYSSIDGLIIMVYQNLSLQQRDENYTRKNLKGFHRDVVVARASDLTGLI